MFIIVEQNQSILRQLLTLGNTMNHSRTAYFFVMITIMIMGLASRHTGGIPLWIGDVLWAMMIFYMVVWLFIRRNLLIWILISLGFCYLIEFSQLYQAPWINRIRHTVLGGLILGETFLWGDLLCYTAGIAICAILQKLFSKVNSDARKMTNGPA
jgi:hypothetical protein